MIQHTVQTVRSSENIKAGVVNTNDLADLLVTTTKLANQAVQRGKIASETYQTGEAAIDSVSAYVAFPSSFPATPEVVATPLSNATWVRVGDVTASSFSWLADTAGSARWVALLR